MNGKKKLEDRSMFAMIEEHFTDSRCLPDSHPDFENRK
jgi:hypothetical protein